MTPPLAGVELRLVELPLRRAHVAAHGTEVARRVVVARVVDEDGQSGWGECSALQEPGYNDETIASAWPALRDELAPALLAGAPLRGGPLARAALTSAVAVLRAHHEGRSLAASLAKAASPGRLPRRAVSSTAVVAVEADLDTLLAEVQLALGAGHRHVKVKIRPGWDLEPLRAVRSTWPDLWLAADANGAYATCPARVAALAEIGLVYLEQPLAITDLAGHSELRRSGGVPIALDEAVTSVAAVEAIARAEAADAVNIKLARLGGPLAAAAAVTAATDAGLAAWCGGMLESGVGRAVSLAVAALEGCTLPTDLGPSSRYVAHDLVEPPFVLEPDGVLAVPQGPGLGVAVRHGRLAAATVERWSAGEVPR